MEIHKKVIEKAWSHLTKAIGLREKIYRGRDEAVERWHQRDAKGQHQTEASAEDAAYKFMTSQTGAELIADQNWQMRQADAHSGMANALLLEALLTEQKKTNQLLANMDGNLDAIHNSIKEMKVY
jgi:hypothetical protein